MLTACDPVPPAAQALTIDAVLAQETATVTAEWSAITDPENGTIQYLWQNNRPDGSIYENGSTSDITVVTGADREWMDRTWEFCVVTQRMEDGLQSQATCKLYIVAAKVVGPPPAVDSITITVN